MVKNNRPRKHHPKPVVEEKVVVNVHQSTLPRPYAGSITTADVISKNVHKNRNPGAVNVNKIERLAEVGEESLKVKKINPDIALRIQQARMKMNWSQRELATVRDYENGTGTPNEKHLQMIERALNVHLRGKLVGKPHH